VLVFPRRIAHTTIHPRSVPTCADDANLDKGPLLHLLHDEVVGFVVARDAHHASCTLESWDIFYVLLNVFVHALRRILYLFKGMPLAQKMFQSKCDKAGCIGRIAFEQTVRIWDCRVRHVRESITQITIKLEIKTLRTVAFETWQWLFQVFFQRLAETGNIYGTIKTRSKNFNLAGLRVELVDGLFLPW